MYNNTVVSPLATHLLSPCASRRTYGGFSNEQVKRENLLKLVESLTRDGMSFQEQPYYTAGYDSPFKLTNRRNEVWILKKAEG